MAVDLRGHPVFPSTGFDAPTRFETDICNACPPCAHDIRPGFRRHAQPGASLDPVELMWVA